MARAVIKAEYARLIQPFISQEDFRYYLNGFAIEPHPNKGVVIVATDGHKLGAFHDESGACDSKMIGAPPQSLASRRVSVRIWATKIQATALAMVASCAETPIIRLVNLLDAPIPHEGGFGIGASDWPELKPWLRPRRAAAQTRQPCRTSIRWIKALASIDHPKTTEAAPGRNRLCGSRGKLISGSFAPTPDHTKPDETGTEERERRRLRSRSRGNGNGADIYTAGEASRAANDIGAKELTSRILDEA